ncbi:M1 family metallopeptidase [Candidatus Saccharibacteria bacterium]|nr:M1 family metallopeptidase [Candidatus Saccharibacteria bacterium]
MHTVTRLTDFFTPINYELSLDLDRLSRTFSGIVTIHGTVADTANEVKLHAKDLVIETALIDGQIAEWKTGDNDEISITKDGVNAGDHTIVIRFSGTITDAMHGLYPCYYEHAGIKKELLATQFESHHAREVFPCIDEPAAKATFDVTLTTEDDVTVLGNMPVTYRDTDGKRMVTKFETSPRMSTYLLAFVVGELQSKSAKTKDGVEVNIWATPAQPAASLEYPLDIAVRSIEFYNDYFGTAYPLPKSDHVALPDFSSGAMENWGLITYREIALLADPETTSISSRQYIATVIAHELAHQWFGNLVTMEWWNDLWLNESFATLMEYLAIDALHPEWNIWLDFVTNESVIALRRDAIDGVQSVQVDVNHPDEISTLFDGAIVYAKGGRLLRMIQNYIGSEAFQTGLKAYFEQHAYKNTVGNDLWEALEKASGKPVASIMNTWISQPGFPVVTLTRNDTEVTLTQEQFFVGPHAESTRHWPIPLNAQPSSLPELFDTNTITVTADTSVQLNIGDTAHFITQYDSASLSELTQRVADMSLSITSRAQLLDEATLLARGGKQSSDTLIPLILAYKNEMAEPVWGIVAMALAELRKFVEDNKDAEIKLRGAAGALVHEQYQRLGWSPTEHESEEDTKLRSTVIGLTLYGENEAAIAKAKEIYESTPLDNLDPELRPLIISSVARYGDAKIVDDLLDAYVNTQSGELRQDICVGITSTRIPEKIDQLLDAIKDPKIVRPQDAARWFVYLIRGRDSKTQAWEWIRDNWQWIIDTFGGDKSYDDYPRYAASALTTREQLQEYKDFFRPMKDIPALTRAIAIGISEIEGRVELIERDKEAVQKALIEY